LTSSISSYICAFDAETDESAREQVHDDQHPVTAQENGFASQQVDAPEAILEVPDECQPGWAVGSEVVRPVTLRERAAHDISVDVDAEGMRDLLRDAYAAELGIAVLKLHDRRDEFHRRTFRTGSAPRGRGRKEQAVFSIDQGLVKLEQRRGLDEGAEFRDPAGAQKQRG
jgi:hypothetical protein